MTATTTPTPTCTAFANSRRIASGELHAVALETKAWIDRNDVSTILVFDDTTAEPVELDFRGSAEEFLRRLATNPFLSATRDPEPAVSPEAPPSTDTPRAPGRPRLGVVAREITLLPRHWDWLARQPGGASVTLRKLVETARRSNVEAETTRRAREATYRFMVAMAGNEAGFEDATRALFAGKRPEFEAAMSAWPANVKEHAGRMAGRAFTDGTD